MVEIGALGQVNLQPVIAGLQTVLIIFGYLIGALIVLVVAFMFLRPRFFNIFADIWEKRTGGIIKTTRKVRRIKTSTGKEVYETFKWNPFSVGEILPAVPYKNVYITGKGGVGVTFHRIGLDEFIPAKPSFREKIRIAMNKSDSIGNSAAKILEQYNPDKNYASANPADDFNSEEFHYEAIPINLKNQYMINKKEIENRLKPLKGFFEKYAGWIALAVTALILYLIWKEAFAQAADVAKSILGAAQSSCNKPPI